MDPSPPRRSSLANISPLRVRRESRVRFSGDLQPPAHARLPYDLHDDFDYDSPLTNFALDPLAHTVSPSNFTPAYPSAYLGSPAPVPDYTPPPLINQDLEMGISQELLEDSDSDHVFDHSSEEDNANVEEWDRDSYNGVLYAGLADLKADANENGYETQDMSGYPKDVKYTDPNDPVVSPAEYLDEKLPSEKDLLESARAAEEAELVMLGKMNYKERRQFRSKVKIEYNVTSLINRQKFLLRLARALMKFGSPSHRIEAQLDSCAKILEVNAEFVHMPGIIICSFGAPESSTSETHFVKENGGLALGCLHAVHNIYRKVVHDEICAQEATKDLNALLTAPPVYGAFARMLLAFSLSTLICPLAFGGSLLDMAVAGVGAIIVSWMQFVSASSSSALYANVFEITMAIFMSFSSRGLSSIRGGPLGGDYFCYTSISSAGIVSILPGYLILTSSLELASKNIVCGSVKMVYALIYTLFIGFGLQIGSDIYLLIDRGARKNLAVVAQRLVQTVQVHATFVSDNSSAPNALLNGTFMFRHKTPYAEAHIFEGCVRSPEHPWFMQTFPWWTDFIIVPLFSILSSMANMQPLFSAQLPVMVVISCIAYGVNLVANHYVFNRSDVVSSIGAFVVGVLGNTYSRKMGGTAFTSMVTGILFLVPSGLSQAGGLTAGTGVDIGGAMIAVTIGITVGLFMSQALVYIFGSSKGAALFTF